MQIAGANEEDNGGTLEAGERVPMQELAARFTEATNELQLLGLLRPAKKRRGNFAQKLIFHSGYIAEAAAAEA